MARLTASAVPASSSVRPSGCARATCSVPMLVLAPARFSTMTLAPRMSASFGAIARASGSLTAPGANGTTRVIVLPEKSVRDESCAAAGAANKAAASPKTGIKISIRAR